MHSVGDVVDSVVVEGVFGLEQLAGYFTMLLGHAVDVMAEVQREISHVQLAGAAKDFVHLREVAAPQNAPDMIQRKPVVTRRDRSVRGEDALRLNCLHVIVVESISVKPASAFIEQFQSQQRRMTLVHVKAADVVITERPEHPNPADAENNFLTQPVVRIAAVKDVRERAIPLRIFRQVRIEEGDRDRMAADSIDCVLPCAQLNGPAFDAYLDSRRKLPAILRNVPFDCRLGLPTAAVELLIEIALSVQQRHRDHWHLEISGRTNGIASEHAQPATVSRHRRVQGDFHREVGDWFG